MRPIHGWYLPCKDAVDFAAALVLGAVALPLIAAAALVVKLTSRGPAFYTQIRVGRDGRLFTIYKIRTMIHNCESLTGPRWSMPGDPRVTRSAGSCGSRTSTSCRSLLNVLRGDMSLIGPRPERPEFVPELERELPAYRQRLTVRPGVTGLGPGAAAARHRPGQRPPQAGARPLLRPARQPVAGPAPAALHRLLRRRRAVLLAEPAPGRAATAACRAGHAKRV